MGKMQDELLAILPDYPDAPFEYLGFSDRSIAAGTAPVSTLLMTPRWMEAFGNVAIALLVCL